MVKPSFLDTLGHYMKGDDLERAKVMMEKSEDEFIAYELEYISVKNTPQNLFACAFVRNRTSRSQNYPIAGVFIVNKGNEPAKFSIRAEIDRNITKISEKTIPANSSSFERISCDDDQLSAYVNMPVLCKVSVIDSYERELTSASGEITVVTEITKPQVEAVFKPAKTSGAAIGMLSIRSREKSTFTVVAKIMSGKDVVSIQPFIISPEQSSDRDITLDGPVVSEIGGSFKPAILVECDGYEICQTRSDEETVPEEGRASTTKLKIFAECTAQRIIDINTQSNGNVVLGAVGITSNEASAQTAVVIASVEGESLFTTTLNITPRSKNIVEVAVPVKHIQRDETYQAEIRFTVRDAENSVVMDRIFTMVIRSRYDLDLHKLLEQTAMFVNPLDPSVERFIETKDGPLAKEMGTEYTVKAYQRESKIIPQIKAVYNAVRNMGMHYVSSTETFREGHYQRVRSPSKVLEDHSGNCIELSILFASILEAMGFETAIVFPYGHAIVGVIMETNAYRSESKIPTTMTDKLLNLGNSTAGYKVLCFEATMCAHKNNTFESAVESAYKTISAELSSINSRSNFTIVEKERQKGVKPRVA